MKSFMVGVSLLAAAMLVSLTAAEGQFAVRSSVLGNGGAATGDGNRYLNSTLGQPAIGLVSDPTYSQGVGYWYLVRGVTTTGPMTYQALYDSQVGLRDPEIEAAPSTCP